MGLGASKGLAVRERTGSARIGGVSKCGRCGGTNPNTAQRCRSCLAPLPRVGPTVTAPRTRQPVVDPHRREFDAMIGELEALTLADDAPSPPQCPECGRLVAEDARRCSCGATFATAEDAIRYECPVCGYRVPETATRCRCGARFAD